ncbi:hypothetical protein CYMTET_14397 [Cymbomonas tetramitiformis]|uniref:Uncharacterized protein n=1 Tax=Cymbomonas tetramitiformis TaxID=36881 RepID=A0AAE0GGN5_9CHLO|nr:hypothetical protein CYMTET_14397 [Cymbomonas tetramitiformis]
MGTMPFTTQEPLGTRSPQDLAARREQIIGFVKKRAEALAPYFQVDKHQILRRLGASVLPVQLFPFRIRLVTLDEIYSKPDLLIALWLPVIFAVCNSACGMSSFSLKQLLPQATKSVLWIYLHLCFLVGVLWLLLQRLAIVRCKVVGVASLVAYSLVPWMATVLSLHSPVKWDPIMHLLFFLSAASTSAVVIALGLKRPLLDKLRRGDEDVRGHSQEVHWAPRRILSQLTFLVLAGLTLGASQLALGLAVEPTLYRGDLQELHEELQDLGEAANFTASSTLEHMMQHMRIHQFTAEGEQEQEAAAAADTYAVSEEPSNHTHGSTPTHAATTRVTHIHAHIHDVDHKLERHLGQMKQMVASLKRERTDTKQALHELERKVQAQSERVSHIGVHIPTNVQAVPKRAARPGEAYPGLDTTTSALARQRASSEAAAEHRTSMTQSALSGTITGGTGSRPQQQHPRAGMDAVPRTHAAASSAGSSAGSSVLGAHVGDSAAAYAAASAAGIPRATKGVPQNWALPVERPAHPLHRSAVPANRADGAVTVHTYHAGLSTGADLYGGAAASRSSSSHGGSAAGSSAADHGGGGGAGAGPHHTHLRRSEAETGGAAATQGGADLRGTPSSMGRDPGHPTSRGAATGRAPAHSGSTGAAKLTGPGSAAALIGGYSTKSAIDRGVVRVGLTAGADLAHSSNAGRAKV